MPHRELLHKLEDLDQLLYCVGERDESTYAIGIFAYDPALFGSTGRFWAISPMFDSTDSLYDYARAKGFVYRCVLRPQAIGKSPC